MSQIKEWFKVISNNQIVGVATDQNFARFSKNSGRVHICQAIEGEYVIVNERYFHDDWMLPVDKTSYIDYENAEVVSISEKEYNILYSGDVKLEDISFGEKISEEKIEKKVPKDEQITIDYIRSRKLKELSMDCTEAIEQGISLVLSDGASHHFSLTAYDQLNLIGIEMSLSSGEDIFYHADGELVQYYSEEDARYILESSKRWKNYNLALYNSFKNWINSMTDLEQIEAITYNSAIPEEFCSSVLKELSDNL